MTARIYFKVLLAVVLILTVAIIGVDLMAAHVAKSTHVASLTQHLADECTVLATFLTADSEGGVGPSNFSDSSVNLAREMVAKTHSRLTIINRDGLVLIDTRADPSRMENHARRLEFVRALSGDVGSDIRTSATTGVPYLYVAIPIPNGALRLAMQLSDVQEQVNAIRLKMLGATALAFLPTILIAAWIARRISQKLGSIMAYAAELANGNYRARLDGPRSGELGILGHQLINAGEHLQRAVEQLDREHTELEKVERVRKDFVINVSHELRTPLASIQGYAETLMDGAIDDKQNRMRFLGIIRQNAERLASLTSDLLTLSRLEMKRTNLDFSTHSIEEVLTEALDTVGPVAAKKQISLSLVVRPDANSVYCDAEAVHQILINLFDNAIKYTPQGGRIAVTAEREPNSGDPPKIRISVSDTGMGIPAEDLPRLFERFYRVDKARSRELGGTGLGLSIVKHLVKAQGGEVGVESSPNEGSTFYFTLSSTVYDPVTAV